MKNTSKSRPAANSKTFQQIFDALDAHEAYQKAISSAEAQVYKSSVPDPDNSNIISNLENLRETGLSDLNSRARSADPRITFSKLLNARDSWVADSAASYAFLEAKCSAEQLYADNLPYYKYVTSSETQLDKAGFSTQVDAIKKKWAEIEYVRSIKSLEAYKKTSELLPLAAAQISQLISSYKNKVSPSPTPKPVQKLPVDNYTIAAIALILGLAAYYFYQKQKAENPQ